VAQSYGATVVVGATVVGATEVVVGATLVVGATVVGRVVVVVLVMSLARCANSLASARYTLARTSYPFGVR
jgi:hypothetical protein